MDPESQDKDVIMMRLLMFTLFFLGVASRPLAGEAPASVDGAITIDTLKARELFEQGTTFIDVRNRNKWRWGRVKGAHHFDLRSTFSLLRYEGFVERDDPVVIYGNGPHSMRAAMATYMASAWGYKNIYYYRDGYFSWLAADFPADLGKPSSNLEAAIFGRHSECSSQC
ncbi:rhodanese-like domain-containing protein [Sansalvadorimonas sp. 2012CJ34-2]|uniref:Rhodanese-like domain-containing protein n=1 Tax=Parendozoicomonas callyspongiae TaxID=2942213 RepID=A0ABT0PD25_9GAMM|nr:rhodanese-like domain-containing protein [Sansalvadorimonas sp. 2012CJ34-2]MCL6269284.1 rhodanese-like domain-containing protein [Sansalvadorimonas sp. 2012CJ34-2]